jgi:hypothetical protein
MTRHLIRLGAVAMASGATLGVAIGGAVGAVSAAAASGMDVGAGAVAGATTAAPVDLVMPTTLAGIKARASTDIANRVNELNGAIAKVNGAREIGAGQEILVSYLGTDRSPLQQLNQKIQGDTAVAQAAQDSRSIFNGYRVYLLVLPASRIAADADRATTAIPNLTSYAAKAQSHVNPGNRTQLQPLVDDLDNQIASATNATHGLAATVLAFTPAQWNADSELLAASRSSAQAAIGALEKGRSDVRQIVLDLKGSATAATLRHAGSASASPATS